MEHISSNIQSLGSTPQSLRDERKNLLTRVPLEPKYYELLRESDFTIREYDQKLVNNRASILGWWINTGRQYLDLRWRTIDQAIRLFDLYCSKKQQNNEKLGHKCPHILASKHQSKLTATASFFTASKYNEIYPPSLNDFIFFDEQNISREVVIKKQVDILMNLEGNYNRALMTDYFHIFTKKEIPDWSCFCYLYAPFTSAEQLAIALAEVVEAEGSDLEKTEGLAKVVLKLKLSLPRCLQRVRTVETNKKK